MILYTDKNIPLKAVRAYNIIKNNIIKNGNYGIATIDGIQTKFYFSYRSNARNCYFTIGDKWYKMLTTEGAEYGFNLYHFLFLSHSNLYTKSKTGE